MAQVYAAIANVMSDLGAEGIAKSHKNQSQGYAFRGIDDVYNTLSALLVKHHLLILPNTLERTVIERETKNGGLMMSVTVKIEYTFISVEDGSSHKVTTYGEAMDSGDKATNKAMSAAYKYAAIQAFCIPTEGDNDADATTHEITGKKQAVKHVYSGKELIAQATTEAGLGIKAYRAFWNELTPAERATIGESMHADFKAKAEEADSSYVPQ